MQQFYFALATIQDLPDTLQLFAANRRVSQPQVHSHEFFDDSQRRQILSRLIVWIRDASGMKCIGR